MTDANRKTSEMHELFQEHVINDRVIARYDERAAKLEAETHLIEQASCAIEERQRAISARVAPLLREAGPVEWWDGSSKCVVRLTDGGSLAIERIRPFGDLAAFDGRRRLDDGEIRESAIHAAFEDAADEDDVDDVDVISLPGRDALIVRGVRAGGLASSLAVIDQEAG